MRFFDPAGKEFENIELIIQVYQGIGLCKHTRKHACKHTHKHACKHTCKHFPNMSRFIGKHR